jgi:hypothetical protein
MTGGDIAVAEMQQAKTVLPDDAKTGALLLLHPRCARTISAVIRRSDSEYLNFSPIRSP